MKHSLKIEYSKLSRLALIGLLLMSQLSWSAIEPRIVGGVESNPSDRGFMVNLSTLEFFAQGDKVPLFVGKTSYTGKLISANNEIPLYQSPKGSQFRGVIVEELVDCGLAESPCEGVSGKVCLIQDGGSTVDEKVQNCEVGGGRVAVIYADQTQEIDESTASASAKIPAIALSARQGAAFLKLVGESLITQVVQGANCGGTLIRKDWVVTAAHCVMQMDEQGNPIKPSQPEQIKVIPGGHEMPTDTVFAVSKEELSVKKVFVHQDFSSDLKNDLALLQLASPAEVGQPLSIIDGPSLATAIDSESSIVVMGRGVQEQLKPGEESSNPARITKLYEVEVPLVSTQTCQESIGQLLPEYQLSDGGFCIGGTPEGGKDACHGDSGGPIVMQKDDGQLFLVGAVSGGIGCAHPNLPSVNTRVPAYASAIENIISGKSDQLKGAPAEPTAVLEAAGSSDDNKAKGGGGSINLLWGFLLISFRYRQIRMRIL